MVQKGEIKTEGDGKGRRKRISEAASPQPEGIATTAKRGEKAKFDLSFNYEQIGRRKRWRHKKKGRRIQAEGGLVMRQKQERPASTVELDGCAYVRSYQAKGAAFETLLRHGGNLSNMVSEVKRVTKQALSDGVYKPLAPTDTASNRHLTLIHGLCNDANGVDARLFFTTKGKQMAKNFSFTMMVYQFFRDVDFAGKVVGAAAKEHSAAGEAGAKAPEWHEARMAAGFATVAGTYYNRSFPAGDLEAERIVRRNLEIFIIGAMGAAKAAMEQGRDSRDVEKYCYPPDGTLRMRELDALDGKPLKDEAMFRRAISQFFLDSEMVEKAVKQALGMK